MNGIGMDFSKFWLLFIYYEGLMALQCGRRRMAGGELSTNF